jgi:hypothetical protein
LLIAVALFYATLSVSWMPWRERQAAVMVTLLVALFVVEMLVPARKPYAMRRPTVRRGERPGRVAEALAQQDLAGAVAAFTARPARRRRSTGQPVCGALTANGERCRRPVRMSELRCHLHRG